MKSISIYDSLRSEISNLKEEIKNAKLRNEKLRRTNIEIEEEIKCLKDEKKHIAYVRDNYSDENKELRKQLDTLRIEILIQKKRTALPVLQ